MEKTNQAQRKNKSVIPYLLSLLVVVAVSAGGFLFLNQITQAATPASGTLSPNTTPPVTNVTWTGTGNGAPPAAMGEGDCAAHEGDTCDSFILTLGGQLSDWSGKRARVRIQWATPATDYDLYIHKDSLGGTVVASSANGTTDFEQADLDPNSIGSLGPFYVHVVYFAAPTPARDLDANQYHGIASAVIGPPLPPPPPPSTCQVSTFGSFKPPSNLVGYNTAGEPSIGINWNTGNVLFLSYINVLRARFNDATSPATATWVNKNPPNQPDSLDPIMFTDPMTGRSIPGQLLAAGGTSATSITDNDGESYIPNVTTGLTNGVDHQTIGAGPYRRNPVSTNGTPAVSATPATSYPNAWYYASQDIGFASLARSDDGGATYGPAFPMYNLNQCGGLHGHVKVAPDGTVYVPNKNCPAPNFPATGNGGQGFAVSEDNGLTFTIRTVPGSGSGDSDPAIGIGAGGRVYFAYTASDKHMHVAVTDNKGVTFHDDQDIGTPFGVKASVFPAAVAGDNNRASVFFHGTGSTSGGNPTGDDTAGIFAGTWYPYIATTCNGGQSWSVVRADNPVQQGVICTSGTTCPSGTRNLLDFMDLQVDRLGRTVAGYADGCNSSGCTSAVNGTKAVNDKTQIATILRQTGGSRLFADYDAGGPGVPILPPPVQVAAVLKGNNLTWQTPDDNGSPLTGYKVYRGVGDGEPALIGEVGNDNLSFRDRRTARGAVYYQVTAVNGYGESPRTLKLFAGKTLLKGE